MPARKGATAALRRLAFAPPISRDINIVLQFGRGEFGVPELASVMNALGVGEAQFVDRVHEYLESRRSGGIDMSKYKPWFRLSDLVADLGLPSLVSTIGRREIRFGIDLFNCERSSLLSPTDAPDSEYVVVILDRDRFNGFADVNAPERWRDATDCLLQISRHLWESTRASFLFGSGDFQMLRYWGERYSPMRRRVPEDLRCVLWNWSIRCPDRAMARLIEKGRLPYTPDLDISDRAYETMLGSPAHAVPVRGLTGLFVEKVSRDGVLLYHDSLSFRERKLYASRTRLFF